MTQSDLPQLSPPQYTYFNELKYSIGNDPMVQVLNLIEFPEDGGYLIPIIVFSSRKKARALATILNLQKELGNITVNAIVIYDKSIVRPYGRTFTAEGLVDLFEEALSSNRYFKFAETKLFSPDTPSVYPVFTKSVIQFFNDDISDLYNNFNEVAAFVFRDVLRDEINGILINPSTEMDSSATEQDAE
ncbi:hypothetical protein [Bacillus sp. UNC438CL73TsuS30]|uniref:hypothetical protein n=1 Tax=Bacillus sp. UNC438CL73TsuS30 TaxID=1340434 RepID=UPI00047DDB90|nr:hypothetical protein [Bacillus sp. UNC438CL73TsuS30]